MGITFPLLFQLLDAYNEREARRLREEGAVHAIATHDPKRLSELEARPSSTSTGKPRDWFDAYEKKR